MGADLLPIGMITDVSAGALGGGGGALPFSGQSEVAGAFQSFLQAGDASGADGVPEQVNGDGSMVANLSAASLKVPLDGGAPFPGDVDLALAAIGEASASGDVNAAPAGDDAGLVDAAVGLPMKFSQGRDGAPGDLLPTEPELVEGDVDPAVDLLDGAAVEAGYVPVPVVDEMAVVAGPGVPQAPASAGAADSGVADDGLGAGPVSGSGRTGTPPPLNQLPLGGDSQTPSADQSGSESVVGAPQGAVVAAAGIGAVSGSDLETPNGSVSPAVQTTGAPAETPLAASGSAQKTSDVAVGSAEPKTAVIETPVPAAPAAGAEPFDGDTPLRPQAVSASETAAANVSGSDDASLVDAKPRRWKTNLPEIARAAGTVSQSGGAAAPVEGTAGETQKVDGALPVGSVASDGIDVSAPETTSVNGNPQVTNVGGDAAATQNAAEALNASAASKGSGAARSGAVGQEFSEILSDADGEALAEEAEADIQSKQLSTAKSDVAEKSVSPGGALTAAEKQTRDGNVMAAAIAAASTNAAADDEAADDDNMSLSLAAKPLSSMDAVGASKSDAMQTSVRAQTNHAAVQVAGAIAHNLKNGNTRFQMRFDPPELGRVDVHMKMSADGSVNAHLVVERPETLDMFLRDQRALERALVSAGLNTEGDGLQFSLQDNGSQGFGSSQNDSDGGAGGAGIVANGVEDGDETLIQVSDVYLNESQSGLDIRI